MIYFQKVSVLLIETMYMYSEYKIELINIWYCEVQTHNYDDAVLEEGLSWVDASCCLVTYPLTFTKQKEKRGVGDNVILNIQYLSFHSNLLFLSEGGGTQRPFSQLPLPTCDYVSLMCLYAGQQLNASIKF